MLKKLEIIGVDNYLYTLKDEQNKTYQIQFEFYDLETMPNIGDYITMPKELLDENYIDYSIFYAFGDVNCSGRKNPSPQEIIYVTNNKNQTKTLKRLYG